ncbi:hypothetical protein Q8X48_26825 [Pseudomonas sp. QLc11A]|jgi:hypothetical protein|uniref:Uncharacterized protein n=1 Tax=Pseudomonas azerbaijanorientalis TaxID=2842350 RepID=A0ABW8WCC3_9PSED
MMRHRLIERAVVDRPISGLVRNARPSAISSSLFQQGSSKAHAGKIVGQKTGSVGASLLAMVVNGNA